jgi:hypothetical protein
MSDTRVHCFFCHRRAVGVDRLTGWLVPHRVRAGRKGPQCPGVGKLAGSQPERGVA